MPQPLNKFSISRATSGVQRPTGQESNRWIVLGVVCTAVFVIVLDGTIVNVALPTLSVGLSASNSQLQWIVDAYLLVFTGLLLAAGSAGDRFGRKRALVTGLVLFGATSAFAGFATSAETLIAGRALMGIGAALIFPATLAILSNLFHDPVERAKAIGIWSATGGVAAAFGPITGGYLLRHFGWSSVFFVNVPIAAVVACAALLLIPESKEAVTRPPDRAGLLLSVAAIASLVFTIIEAPGWGWTSLQTMIGFATSVALIACFIAAELRTANPMIPLSIFRNPKFSAASAAVTAASFALFGFVFLVTQYFQSVRGYSALETGVRSLPVAFAIVISSVTAPILASRFGTREALRIGLGLMTGGFLWISTRIDVDTNYLEIVGQMIVLGAGLGFTTAPATESIMSALPSNKAGIGSAVNDTTRELGGTLGVAIVGSAFSSFYISSLDSIGELNPLSPEAKSAALRSIGSARQVASGLGADEAAFLERVNDAFLSGFSAGTLVAAAMTFGGVALVSVLLRNPHRATSSNHSPDDDDHALAPNPVKQLRLVVEVEEFDRAVAFYRDTLGLSELAAFEADGDARVIILDAGRATLELANPAQKRMIDEVEADDHASDRIRVAFEVADTVSMTNSLRIAGAEVVAEPTETPWRSLNSRLNAPADLQLTLFEELQEPSDAHAQSLG